MDNEFSFRLYLLYIFLSPFIYFVKWSDRWGISIFSFRRILIFALLITAVIHAIRGGKFRTVSHVGVIIGFLIYLGTVTLLNYWGLLSNHLPYLETGNGWNIASNFQLYPIGQIVSFLFATIVPLWFGFQVLTNHKRIRTALAAFVMSGFVLSAYGLVQWVCKQFFGVVLNTMFFDFWVTPGDVIHGIYFSRLYSFGGEPKNLASFLVITLILSVLLRSRGYIKWVQFAALLLTISISGFIAFFLSIVALLLIDLRSKNNRAQIATILGGVLALPTLYFTVPIIRGIIDVRFLNRLRRSEIIEPFTPHLSSPHSYDSPFHLSNFIFGTGYGEMPFRMLSYFENIDFDFYRLFLIRIFIELGLIGLVWYLYIFASNFRVNRALSRRLGGEEEELNQILIATCAVAIVTSACEVNFYAWIILALILSHRRWMESRLKLSTQLKA